MKRDKLLQAIEKIAGGKKREFAKIIGVSPVTVSRWLGGGGMHKQIEMLIESKMK